MSLKATKLTRVWYLLYQKGLKILHKALDIYSSLYDKGNKCEIVRIELENYNIQFRKSFYCVFIKQQTKHLWCKIVALHIR